MHLAPPDNFCASTLSTVIDRLSCRGADSHYSQWHRQLLGTGASAPPRLPTISF